MKRDIYYFYILLGVGIGIIITSVFFILNPYVKYKEYSNEEIIEMASELGMVTVKESIGTNNEKEIKIEEEKVEGKTFTIRPGQSLIEIANNLFENGIIEDKKEFVQFIMDNKMEKRLLPGDYILEKNLSYSTLMKILTSVK